MADPSPKELVLRFGRHNGKTIEQIGESDDGLKYLDWLVGETWLEVITKRVIRKYLSDPTIKAELSKLVGG